MADKSKNSHASGDRSRHTGRDTMILLAVALLSAAGIAAGLVFGVSALWNCWFDENPRLTLRQVRLSSKDRMDYRGYWNSHRPELLRRLRLRLPIQMWTLDTEALRLELEDPGKFSSVQSARVYLTLPDTLDIELTERTPVAFVDRAGARFVVDETCMLILRRESMAAQGRWVLPVIRGGGKRDGRPGERDAALAPAVALIMEAQRNFPRLKISEIVLLPREEKMLCRFRFGSSGPESEARFPVRHYRQELGSQLKRLEGALIRFRQEGIDRREFDLSFRERLVSSPPPGWRSR